MPQPCKICTHPNRAEIDRCVVSGEPNRRIASRFNVSEAGIRRHRAAHIPKALAKAEAAKELAQADSLVDEVRETKARASKVVGQIESLVSQALDGKCPHCGEPIAQDPKLAALALHALKAMAPALRELRGYLQLKGELTRELGDSASQPSGPQVLIVLPPTVPPGTIAPLYPEREVIDVTPPRQLPPPEGHGAAEAN